MARPSRFSPEVRERAVRMVFEHAQDRASQWAAIPSIAEKIGCAAETLRSWVRQAERDDGRRLGLATDEHARFKQLERENVELRRANEILRLASGYFPKAEPLRETRRGSGSDDRTNWIVTPPTDPTRSRNRGTR
jgi:transposase